MKIAFAGTPAFAAPILEALAADPRIDVVLVFAQPARPSGRGLAVVPGPVEAAAAARGIPVRTPAAWDDVEVAALAGCGAEVLVTAAYGILLPDAALDACPRGSVNVHASLLPRWRGAAPIQRAIEDGDRVTGLTLFRIRPGPVDSGPVIALLPLEPDPRETSASLSVRLSRLAADRLADELLAWRDGQRPEKPQSEDGVTRARKLRKEESHLAWTLDADVLDRKVRAFTPWPGVRVGALRILEAVPREKPSAPAGTVLSLRPLVVACGRGAVELVRVQRDGGRPQTGSEWANGARLAAGSLLP